MYIVQHAPASAVHGERIVRATPVDGAAHGFHIWVVTLDPGAHGALYEHGGELAMIAVAGCGKLVVDGGPQRFFAPCTLQAPPGVPFRVVNHGSTALQLVCVFTQVPTACPDAGADVRDSHGALAPGESPAAGVALARADAPGAHDLDDAADASDSRDANPPALAPHEPEVVAAAVRAAAIDPAVAVGRVGAADTGSWRPD